MTTLKQAIIEALTKAAVEEPTQAAAASLADDLLDGVGAIAKFMYGADTPKNRRRIYHLHATKQIPTFRMGNRVQARPSRLVRHIEELENARAA
jgi:hypothetical protein